jgi:hypothetical protein
VRWGLGEFGNDGVAHADGFSQMTDKRLEELLSGACGRPFDRGAKCVQIVGHN